MRRKNSPPTDDTQAESQTDEILDEEASPREEREREVRMPSLFARETHLLGWQGVTATIPLEWNLARFAGTWDNGHLRVDDEDGPRFELRWEKSQRAVDVERSIENFLKNLSKEHKKRKEEFQVVEEPKIVSKSRPQNIKRQNLLHFGWVGERDNLTGQGYGAIWKCDTCGRVIVAHFLARGNERPEKAQRLAGEVLASMSCHGNGGWQTWSVFDLRLDVPEEFALTRSKLLAGRIELEWTRGNAKSVLSRLELLTLTRFSLADVVLHSESLQDWTSRVAAFEDKKYIWRGWKNETIKDHDGVISQGNVRDLRLRLKRALWNFVMRRTRPLRTQRVWHCEQSNKIFVLSSDLASENEHVATDVIDALECH
jgi:hypothetical protein